MPAPRQERRSWSDKAGLLAVLAAASQLVSLAPAALITGSLLTGLGGALYLARHNQRGGAGDRADANRQIDDLNTPLMRAAKTRRAGRTAGAHRFPSRPAGS